MNALSYCTSHKICYYFLNIAAHQQYIHNIIVLWLWRRVTLDLIIRIF